MNNTIWVIIPVYNVEKLLGKCVKTLKNQTYKDWKAVLVDDGSTDGSGKLCDKLAEQDSRIISIHQPNAGPSAARKAGIKLLPDNGYCAFVDSDDTLPSDALRLLYDKAAETQADIVCGQFCRQLHGIKIKSKFTPPCFRKPMCYSHGEVMSKLYVSCFGITDFPVNLCGKLFTNATLKKVMLDNSPIPKCFAEDMDVTMRLLPLIDKVAIIDNIIYNYRIGGGTSKFMPTFLDDSILIYDRKKEYFHYYTGDIDLWKLTVIDFKNVLMTYLVMCERFNRFSKGSLKEEFEFLLSLQQTAEIKPFLSDSPEEQAILQGNYALIEAIVKERAEAINRREKIKKIIMH